MLYSLRLCCPETWGVWDWFSHGSVRERRECSRFKKCNCCQLWSINDVITSFSKPDVACSIRNSPDEASAWYAQINSISKRNSQYVTTRSNQAFAHRMSLMCGDGIAALSKWQRVPISIIFGAISMIVLARCQGLRLILTSALRLIPNFRGLSSASRLLLLACSQLTRLRYSRLGSTTLLEFLFRPIDLLGKRS
jgi:hypothetical protein